MFVPTQPASLHEAAPSGPGAPLAQLASTCVANPPPPAPAQLRVVNPQLELCEPLCRSASRARVSTAHQEQNWTKLSSLAYSRNVDTLLRRRQLLPLLEHIDYIGRLLSIQHLILNAALTREDTPEKVNEHATNKQREHARLRTLAAMLTLGDWPVTDKIQGLQKVQQALKSADASLLDYTFFGEPYLHLACRSQSTGDNLSLLVAFYIGEGADCNAVDMTFSTPCHLLRRQINPIPALVTLINNGANPNAIDAFGYTAMHRLTEHPLAASALAMCATVGGNFHAVTARGETLLHMLLKYRDDADAAAFLLFHGISPHARDAMGLNAFDYATMLSRTHTRPHLGQPEAGYDPREIVLPSTVFESSDESA